MLSSLLAAAPVAPHLKMPSAQWWFTAWLGLPLAVTVGVAVRHLLSGRGPLLLYCVLGGAIASLYEAIVNVLGAMVYAEDGIWAAYSTFDRQIPVLIPLAYAWYVGGMAYIAYRLFCRGITRRQLFLLWAADFVIDMVIETPGIVANVYDYFGKQPFDFWGFPFWYGWVNPLMPMIAGALIFTLRPHLEGAWKQLVVIALIPMADGVAYAATCLPIWSALNTGMGYWATYPAALATLALTMLVVWIISLVVCERGEVRGKATAAAGAVPGPHPAATPIGAPA